MKKEAFYLDTQHGGLWCTLWCPEGEVRAVLQIVHGMQEYTDRYEGFAAYLCEKGIAVIGHDHPGHGNTAKDEGELGIIKRKGGTALLTDCAFAVTQYAKERFFEKKVFILGHSMGSFVCRRYLTKYGFAVDGACIMGTAAQPLPVLYMGRALVSVISAFKGEKSPSPLLTAITFAGYNKRFLKEEGPHAWISTDREVVKCYEADPFCAYTFSVGGFGVLYDLLLELGKGVDINKVPKTLPVLVTSGSEDPVGAYGKGPTACAREYEALGLQRVSLRLYEGMRHEILNEINKETVYADILSWLLENMG